jgi:uncharacterized RDD family membrane protein YckC
MTAQWINARILKRGGREYRLSIDDVPAPDGWVVAEEHSVCFDGATDRVSTEALLKRLCEPSVSYDQAKKLLADLRGQVLGQTPDSILKRKYATFWPRVAAHIADVVMITTVLAIGWLAFSHWPATWVRVVSLTIAQFGFVVYEIVMHGLYGQTLGKMSCRVIVRDISERPLSMKQAVLRDIVSLALAAFGLWVYVPQVIQGGSIDFTNPPFLSGLFSNLCIGWTLIDAVTMLTNNKRRALHDYIAGTVVICTEADASFIAASRQSLH